MRCILYLLVLTLVLFDVSAQGMPGGGRGGRGGGMGGGMGGHPRGEAHSEQMPNSAARLVEPYGALERELPSLKVDLMIRAEQLDAWRTVERDVRDIAEMERARRRHLLAIRGSEQSTALTFVSSMAEDDRMKSDAAAEFKRHFEALYAILDDAQRAKLDRRVIQSQEEPLGSEKRQPPR